MKNERSILEKQILFISWGTANIRLSENIAILLQTAQAYFYFVTFTSLNKCLISLSPGIYMSNRSSA